MGAVAPHKVRFAGEPVAAKLARVKDELGRSEGLLVSDCANLAWLLNIRAADVPHTPAPLGFVYVPRAGRPTLFMASGKLTPAVREGLRRTGRSRRAGRRPADARAPGASARPGAPGRGDRARSLRPDAG